MPNLREIIQEVNQILDYNPTNEAYRTAAARVVNRHYLEISGQYPWLFLQKVKTISLYASVSGSGGVTVQRDGANPRKINGVGTSFHSGMDGQKITIVGEEYLIVRAASATEMYVRPAVSTAAATEDWTVTFSQYPLPEDCGDPLGFMSRDDDRGRLTFVDSLSEELDFLDADQGGDPDIIIEGEAKTVQSPDTPLLATVNAGGSLTASTTYEYMYTIVECGRESPPSLLAEATTTVADKTIVLSNMVSLDYSGGTYSGRTRKIYRRTKTTTTNQRFVFLDEQDTAGSGTTYTDAGAITPVYGTDVYRENGPRQYFRPWATPGSDIDIEVRYQSVPERLQADADSPAWPTQSHALLVYRAVQDIAAQHGMTGIATIYERRANLALEKMRDRHLNREVRDYVRKGFTDRSGWRRRYRYGTPTKIP